MNQTASQYALWLVLSLPGLFLIIFLASDFWTYGQAVSKSGEWSAQLLILTLAVTPLRRMFGATGLIRFLLRGRRDLGVATFFYTALHTSIYIGRKADIGLIATEAQELWLAAGWVAMVALSVLAATSNNFSVRILRNNWKLLHRLAYASALLIFIHWVLSAFDPFAAYLHLALLLSIEALRFLPTRN